MGKGSLSPILCREPGGPQRAHYAYVVFAGCARVHVPFSGGFLNKSP